MNGILGLLGGYCSDEEDELQAVISNPTAPTQGLKISEEHKESDKWAMPVAQASSSGSTDREARMNKITFNLHELDDPSAISRFLLEYDIYDRDSGIPGLYPDRPMLLAQKEEFKRFVCGELSCDDLLQANDPHKPIGAAPTAAQDAPSERRRKKSRWDEK